MLAALDQAGNASALVAEGAADRPVFNTFAVPPSRYQPSPRPFPCVLPELVYRPDDAEDEFHD